MSEIIEQIKLLEKEIDSLPVGYISKKIINGKTRFYRQWTENGKIRSKYIKDGEYEEISQAIGRRKHPKGQRASRGNRKKMPDNGGSHNGKMCKDDERG